MQRKLHFNEIINNFIILCGFNSQNYKTYKLQTEQFMLLPTTGNHFYRHQCNKLKVFKPHIESFLSFVHFPFENKHSFQFRIRFKLCIRSILEFMNKDHWTHYFHRVCMDMYICPKCNIRRLKFCIQNHLWLVTCGCLSKYIFYRVIHFSLWSVIDYHLIQYDTDRYCYYVT